MTSAVILRLRLEEFTYGHGTKVDAMNLQQWDSCFLCLTGRFAGSLRPVKEAVFLQV